MSASLVGSEMCIRDRETDRQRRARQLHHSHTRDSSPCRAPQQGEPPEQASAGSGGAAAPPPA
eukprot:14567075-Alexandrium_andersonii.AAC.1